MNEQDKRRGDMRPAGPAKGVEAGSVEERNIERLLRRAYDPEEPNETFAAQMQAEMLAAARDEAAGARRRRAGCRRRACPWRRSASSRRAPAPFR